MESLSFRHTPLVRDPGVWSLFLRLACRRSPACFARGAARKLVRPPMGKLVLGRAVCGRLAAATVLEPVLLEANLAAVGALATELQLTTGLNRVWKPLFGGKEKPSRGFLRVLVDAISVL
jgi:hypothetical protein